MSSIINKSSYASQYRAEWSKYCLKPSKKKGATYAYCTFARRTFALLEEEI